MPIASKLVYFQRRPSLDRETEPSDPRRRTCRDSRRHGSSLFSHHKPGQELVPGNRRDAAAKTLGLTGTTTEHGLNRSVSDQGRLPDAVQQARERLLERLNSVDLSGRRQKTWPLDQIWAGATTSPAADRLGVSTSSTDRKLGRRSVTNRFLQPAGESVPASLKLDESAAAEPAVVGNNTNSDESVPPVTLVPQPVVAVVVPGMLLQPAAACRGGGGGGELPEEEGERRDSSAECSICLERCENADGLIQLRCNHVFHSSCLERWLRSRGDCPYCRANVLL